MTFESDHFSDTEVDILLITLIFNCCLSVLGSGFLILFILGKQINDTKYVMILMLGISDFGAAISGLIALSTHESYQSYNYYCNIVAAFLQFFYFASWCWILCITYSVYSIIDKLEWNHVKPNLPYYYLFAWGLPTVTSVLIITFQLGNDSGFWCYITSDSWRLGLELIPVLIVFIFSPYFLISASRKNNDLKLSFQSSEFYYSDSSSQSVNDNESVISFFWRLLFVEFICWIPMFINRTYEFYSSSPSYILFFFHGFFITLQGFGDSFVYGLELKKVFEEDSPKILQESDKSLPQYQYYEYAEDD